MKQRAFLNTFLAVLLAVGATGLLASAETDFELGVAAFKDGDNESAVTYFESAMNQGMDTVALRYNLASSYYKVGRYDDAEKYFLELLETDAMRDLAGYNLGLIAVKKKDWDAARTYFGSVAESGRDEKLTRLSEKQLAKLTMEESRFAGIVLANIGYDDNIVSVSDESAQNRSDSFYDLYASASYLLSGKRKNGWIVDATLFRLDYKEDDDYDVGMYWLGLKKTFSTASWNSGAHIKLIKSTYADDDYLTSGMLDLTGNTKLSEADGIYLRYRFEDIHSDSSIYDYLAGWRQRASAEYRRFFPDSLAQFTYELELNNRSELVTAVDSYQYSPTRHTLRGKYTHIVNKWRLSGDVAYRHSSFPASATIDRTDKQWSLAVAADYHFDKTFKLTGKLQYINNESTVDRYEYDKSIVKIGLGKSF